jgi:hypothetical protein
MNEMLLQACPFLLALPDLEDEENYRNNGRGGTLKYMMMGGRAKPSCSQDMILI